MFARYLHRSGIHMGRKLYVERITNPHGHYEDLDFLNLQREEVARHFGGEDYLVTEPFTPGPVFVAEAERLLEARKNEHGEDAWGWKDPRTTLFLDHWSSLDATIRFVFMLRSPRLVVHSLCKRLHGVHSPKKKDLYLRTYIHYNERVRDFMAVHGPKACLIALDRLIADPETVLARLGAALGRSCDTKRFRELFDDGAMSSSGTAYMLFNRKRFHRAQALYEELRVMSL